MNDSAAPPNRRLTARGQVLRRGSGLPGGAAVRVVRGPGRLHDVPRQAVRSHRPSAGDLRHQTDRRGVRHRVTPRNFMLMELDADVIGKDEVILVTGATGFLGPTVVRTLLDRGFRRVRCLTRTAGRETRLPDVDGAGHRVEVFRGNLLSRDDCVAATRDAAVILHLAAARGEKSFPDAFLNSVVTTRNLLEACLEHQCLRRFVTVSSFTVYSNRQKPRGRLLDESCPVEAHPELRGDPYCFAKTRQDDLVAEYGKKFGIPYVIVRPAYVYGPGTEAILGRVGIR